MNTKNQHETASAGQNTRKTNTKFHSDGTITYWDVFRQQWHDCEPKHVPDKILASLPSDERELIIAAAAPEAPQTIERTTEDKLRFERDMLRMERAELYRQRDELLAAMRRIVNTHIMEAQRIAKAAIANVERGE